MLLQIALFHSFLWLSSVPLYVCVYIYMCVCVCVCIYTHVYMWSEVKLLSHVWLFVTPWTVAHQASPSIGFSRQEYWSGLPLPSPGESSQPRDQTQVSRVAGRHFTIWATREAQHIYMHHIFFIHLSVDGHLGCSHVCLLYIVLQLIWRCMYLFELCFSLIYAPEWDCRIIW